MGTGWIECDDVVEGGVHVGGFGSVNFESLRGLAFC